MRQSSPLPAAFVEGLDAADRDRILASMAAPKKVAYWVNPLVVGAVGLGGEAVVGLQDVFVLPPDKRETVTRSIEAHSGRIYPMNPSSRLAPLTLAPLSGDEVLDLAAAPGGKTIMLAAQMGNVGRIAAVEPVRARFFRLKANLERCGVEIAQLYRHDGRDVGRKTPGRFDRVLLDAPCSSEGRFRSDDPGTFEHWSPRKVRETARKQRGLIRSAYRALKPGGTLVYCTCAYSTDENEAIVEHLLHRERDARLTRIELAAGDVRYALDGAVRVLPDSIFDGFFVAKVAKPA